MEVLKKRAEAIYKEDESKAVRMSHENEEVKKLYAEYLGEIYGEKAHALLHTHYQKRDQI
jgi:iron only hydrogenase large subunit-like protein